MSAGYLRFNPEGLKFKIVMTINSWLVTHLDGQCQQMNRFPSEAVSKPRYGVYPLSEVESLCIAKDKGPLSAGRMRSCYRYVICLHCQLFVMMIPAIRRPNQHNTSKRTGNNAMHTNVCWTTNTLPSNIHCERIPDYTPFKERCNKIRP